MNRRIWAGLEDWCRRVARAAYFADDSDDDDDERGGVTLVTTGPLWLPHHQTGDKSFRYHIDGIGKPPTLVLVPTHFFKVVVVLTPRLHRDSGFRLFRRSQSRGGQRTSTAGLRRPLDRSGDRHGSRILPGPRRRPIQGESGLVDATAATAACSSLAIARPSARPSNNAVADGW